MGSIFSSNFSPHKQPEPPKQNQFQGGIAEDIENNKSSYDLTGKNQIETIVNESSNTQDNKEEINKTKTKEKQSDENITNKLVANKARAAIFHYDSESILKAIRDKEEIKKISIFNYENISNLEELSKSSFGSIMKAFNKDKLNYITLKKYLCPTDDADHLNSILLEHSLLKAVEDIYKANNKSSHCSTNNNGIFKESSSNETNYILQLEGGICTLDDVLIAGKKYSVEETLYVLNVLVDGLALLEEKGIANRNIKASNVILVGDTKNEGEFIYKIRDFGNGCVLSPIQKKMPIIYLCEVDNEYAAPEILELKSLCENDSKKANEYSYDPFVADVFSLGVLAIKMLNYQIKREQIDEGALKNHIGESKFQKEIQQLIELMLIKEPKQRANFIELRRKITSLIKNLSDNFMNKKSICMMKPVDELDYFKLHENKKEEKYRQTLKSAIELYKKHYEFYNAYKKNAVKSRLTKYHLDVCFDLLSNDIKNFLSSNNNNNEMNFSTSTNEFDLDEEISICLMEYAEYFLNLNDFNNSQRYLDKCLAIKDFLLNKDKNIGEIINDKEEKYLKDRTGKRMKSLMLFSRWCGIYAILYKNLGILKKAEEFYNISIKISVSLRGENNAEIAQSYNNLGNLYENLGDVVKSEEFYKKSLEINANLFGENNSTAAASYNNLGNFYYKTGDLKKAEEFQKKSLEITISLFGEIHSTTVAKFHSLGSFYYNMGNMKKAEELYKKSLEISFNLFGENHANTATSYYSLGLLYKNIGDLKKSEELYQKSLQINFDLFGENHSNTANSYHSLGALYKNLGDLKKSEIFYMKSHEIKVNLFGENHPDIATSYNNLGSLYYNLGDLKKAKEFYKKSLKILIKLFGKNHFSKPTMHHNFDGLNENFYENLKKLKKIKKSKKKSGKIKKIKK